MGNDGTTAYVSVATREESPDFDPEEMGVACVAVLLDGTVYFFEEDELGRLFKLLSSVDRVVGVNEFGLEVLEPYTRTVSFDVEKVEFTGIQAVVSDSLGERVSLNNVAKNTLGRERPDPSRLPLEWRSGRKETVRQALKNDVLILRELHRRASSQGYLWVKHPETLEERKVEVDI
ncbi:MAG: hypothetical protein SV760_05850 [Halobacteria archaeon]|nr:hypothetical protein [Halobacteria archaeon]